MYLFFDTETNGKALNFNAPVYDLNNWPRITQLGWQLYDKDQQLISEKSHLIKPDGWVVPKEKFFIIGKPSAFYRFCVERFFLHSLRFFLRFQWVPFVRFF